MEGESGVSHVLWLGTGVMLALAFGIIFLVLSYQNLFSRIKRREAEQLLKVSLESERSERQRIAADLHDSVSGDLVAIRNYLMMLQRARTDSLDSSIFSDLKESVENALASTRQVSHRLMPPMLDTFGLRSALADYFERMPAGVMTFKVEEGENPALPSEIAYELFRTVQELTTNMQKYSQATQCTICMHQKGALTTLWLTDDGVPFDFFSALAHSKGAGLKNVDSRLRVIGAGLTQPPVKKGNQYRIELKTKPC